MSAIRAPLITDLVVLAVLVAGAFSAVGRIVLVAYGIGVIAITASRRAAGE